jgi:hypothetical protein
MNNIFYFSKVIGGQRSHVQELQFPEFKKLGGNEGHHYPKFSYTLQWPLLNVIHILGGTENISQVKADE